MKGKFLFQQLSASWFYLTGLILFFALHRWNELYDFLDFRIVLKVMLLLLSAFFVYFFICNLFYRNKAKSGLFTVMSFFLFLFFSFVESVSAFLWKIGIHANTKVVLLIILFVLFLLIFFKKKGFPKAIVYLNSLFVILIGIECAQLAYKGIIVRRVQKEPFTAINGKVDTKLQRPSVYLILLDEYAGAESLKKYYGFDNHLFVGQLKELGFKVVKKASSNYNYTLLSVASMLNGEYLKPPGNKSVYSNDNYTYALSEIYQNKTFLTFERLGYKTVNYSPFPVKGALTEYSNSYLPVKSSLMLHPTVFDEIIELLPFYIARKIKANNRLAAMFKEKISVNYRLMKDVLKESSTGDVSGSKFYYVHLMMPHAPFAVDSSGNININFLTAKSMTTETKREAYFQYLVHTNKVMSEFISKLKENTRGEAVIMLMSDHGSRDLMTDEDAESGFNSLNAVYYPGKDSSFLYEGFTNVNQFRLLFSAITQTKIPLLKDSLVLR